MKVLALDISTKTGWALLEDNRINAQPVLLNYGLINTSEEVKKLKKQKEYPWGFFLACAHTADELIDLITKTEAKNIVIEETNPGGRGNRYSQKILEYIHCLLILGLDKSDIKVYYINSSEWRRALGLVLSKDDKKNNKLLKKAKDIAEATKTNLDKTKLGIKGKVTKKHVAVRWVNERYNKDFKIKDNDTCEAICLGCAYIKGAKICNGE